jgi:spectinomycin phosphotransferase
LVDWDEVILAPKERDLMFVIGGIGRGLVRATETARFLEGYGDAAIDAKALVYYRYAWAAQDMGAYAEQALFTPEASAESRREALAGFKSLFEPGNIVSIAFESDTAS